MRNSFNARQATVRWAIACVFLVSLAACQAPPAAPVGATGFSLEQKQVLREWGFQEGQEAWTLQSLGKLLFEVDSDVLLPTLHAKVDSLGRALKSVGITRMRVEGHTDNQGSRAYNEELSLRRARAVVKVLVGAGLPSSQVTAEGFAYSRPVHENDTQENRRENRRAAIVIPVPSAVPTALCVQ